RDRNDPGLLERIDGGEQLRPRRWRGGDAGLGEVVLVVPEPDHADVPRDAVDPAVDRVGPEGGGNDVANPSRHSVGDVLDDTGLYLLPQHTATPGLEEVRRVARLGGRGQGSLECLVLPVSDVDLYAGVRGHELVGELLPDRLEGLAVLDEPPVDLLNTRDRKSTRLNSSHVKIWYADFCLK